MPPIVSVVLAASLSVALLYAANQWLRNYAAHLGKSSETMDSFYQAAQRLIRDENVPATVIRVVEFMAANAGRPWLARSFALHVMFGRNKTPNLNSQLAKDLSKLNQQQRTSFAEIFVCGMMTSALADPIFAHIYINLLTIALTKSGKKEDAPSEERARSAAIDLARHAGICAA